MAHRTVPPAQTGSNSSESANARALATYARPQPMALRNWPVSWRLVSVIVIALVMGLIFGVLRVTSATTTATRLGHVTQLALLGQQDTALAQAMENERDVTAGAIAGHRPTDSGAVKQARAATNAAAAKVRGLAAAIGAEFPASSRAAAAAVLSMVDALNGLRTETTESADPLESSSFYTEAISSLFTLNDEIAENSGDSVLVDDVRTLGQLSRTKDAASQLRAILYAALISHSFEPGAMQELTGTQGLETADLVSFLTSATGAQVNDFLATLHGRPSDTTQLVDSYIPVVGGRNTARIGIRPGTAPRVWYATMSATINGMRSVELQLVDSIVARSQSLENGARQSAIVTAIVTAAILLLTLIATLVVARSLVRPLRRLRAGALEVATAQLPERVRAMGENPDLESDLDVAPIDVQSADEIGQVARAFDQVHAEAVRLAGNEAMLRASLNGMFVSLSRRSMSLLERLARMIDSLEQNEEDPDRLSSLFSMDHLVTRMRRNSENLLVLAGHEPVRKWGEPVPLADVARAAASEIEQYARVVLTVQPGIAVTGQATTDVVHLLAEIIENATFFSPRNTDVHVLCYEVASGGVLIEVCDNGVGISETRLAELNWRLDNPPVIDVSASRHMGLFAVSRLAARHGIRVRLRPSEPRGLTALVWLPEPIIVRLAVGYSVPAAPIPAQAGFRLGVERVSAAGLHRPGLPEPGQQVLADPGNGHSGNGHSGNGQGQRQEDQAQEDQAQDGRAVGHQGDRSGRSPWFRARRPSTGAPRPGKDARPAGNRPAAAVMSRAPAGENAQPAHENAQPAHENATTAHENATTASGLPVRVPQANRRQGSPAGEGMPWASAPVPAPRPVKRSPDGARGRLRGFQRGGRRAEEEMGSTG